MSSLSSVATEAPERPRPAGHPDLPAVADVRRHRLPPVVRALRPHQWAKNALVAVPALLAHALGWGVVADVALAFAAMSLCASGTYVVNDLLDRQHDRLHPTKRHRPFASGALGLGAGVAMAVGLVGGAFALAWWTLPLAFVGWLGVYTATTLAYSLRLKAVETVDVLVLAGLYTLRLLAGGAAVGVAVSEWLLAFSLFLFLSLALLKRFVELRKASASGGGALSGRGYRASDAEMVSVAGLASGFVAVLVFTLYLASPAVAELYARPSLLWLVAAPLLYWVLRLWMLAYRGQMHDDPVAFAATDRASYVSAALVLTVLMLAA